MNREPAKRFEDLIVWQKAITGGFPKEEIYGLTSQFRRAAISVLANIAEGFKKKGKADKIRFMNIAQGSLEECRYYAILSKDLKYSNDVLIFESISEFSKLLDAYQRAIKISSDV